MTESYNRTTSGPGQSDSGMDLLTGPNGTVDQRHSQATRRSEHYDPSSFVTENVGLFTADPTYDPRGETYGTHRSSRGEESRDPHVDQSGRSRNYTSDGRSLNKYFS